MTIVQYVIVLTVSSRYFVGILVNTYNLGLLEHVVSIYGPMKLVFNVYFMGLFAGFPTTPPFVLNPGAGQDPYLLNLAASRHFNL
jgi:hypothetical protein